ncbi:MAG: LysM peptidoglycan-binding domain-containing protein, partial [Flavobacteriales bacterium]
MIENRNGEDFFVHQVLQGHTLYSLSKLYNVSVEDITKNNESALVGLDVGQTLYIPVPDDYNSSKWTNPIRIENGVMIHRVMKRETLYGISKLYGVDINDMLAENSGIELGLKEGIELRIPKAVQVESVAIDIPKPPVDESTMHKVAAGETLYSIARFNQCTVEELIELNPGVELGLDIDQLLYLPTEEVDFTFAPTEKENFEVTFKDTSLVKKSYQVAVILPFFLNKSEKDLSTKEQRLRDVSMSFYRGAALALDTLEIRGANLTIEILDCGPDGSLDEILKSNSIANTDVIIGPLQKADITKVAEFSSRRGIHVVCPTLSKNSILLSSSNLSKVKASEASHMKTMAEFVAQNHQGENIILINSKQLNDARKVQLFKKYYNEALGLRNDSGARALVEFEASSKFVGDLAPKLSKARRNILIVPAGKESRSMVANLQTKLQLIDKEVFQMVIYGTEDWFDFDFLDASFKNDVALRLPSSSYVDYEDARNKNFVKLFRNNYATDPTDYGFLG